MELVVITKPGFFPCEGDIITSLFESGLKILHLRKPDSSISDMEELLMSVPACYHGRITLHDNFSLIEKYGIGGVHLNRRNGVVPSGFNGRVSCSCHSLQEVADKKSQFSYVFLSPIFDSISKEGYSSIFSDYMLRRALRDGVIDDKVYALGGVNIDKIDYLSELRFGGVAVLGDLWNKYDESGRGGLLSYFAELLSKCKSFE